MVGVIFGVLGAILRLERGESSEDGWELGRRVRARKALTLSYVFVMDKVHPEIKFMNKRQKKAKKKDDGNVHLWKFNMKRTLLNDADHKMILQVASGYPSVAYPSETRSCDWTAWVSDYDSGYA